MNQPISFRHRNIELQWHGWCMLCKKGEFIPLRLSYNTTAGWWIDHRIFLSVNQFKKLYFSKQKIIINDTL